MSEDPRSAVVDEVVAEALETYGELLAPQDRALAREMLADILATHPLTAELIDAIVPAPVLEESDTIGKDGPGARGADPSLAGGDHE